MDPAEPPDHDQPVDPTRGVQTLCYTCKGTGVILRRVAASSGEATITQTCPQCDGNRFLPGLQPPV